MSQSPDQPTRVPIEETLVDHHARVAGTDPAESRQLLDRLFTQARNDALGDALITNDFIDVDALLDRYYTPEARSFRDATDVATAAADELTINRIDAATQAVAAHLPYAATEADMGAVMEPNGWALYMTFGERAPDTDPDNASIDPNTPNATWLFSSHEATEITDSGLTLDTDPADVATWINDQARAAGSPAYIVHEAQQNRAANGYTAPPSRSLGGGHQPAVKPTATENAATPEL